VKKYLNDGSIVTLALFAKNPSGKSALISSDDFDVDSITDEQSEYAKDELGEFVEFYVEEM
jgi:hypothetical protein